MTIYDQTGKIVEKKFYHSEWKLTDLLKARNDGLLTDEGEAWKYRYSHMDGTGGKYDLLFRREPAAIEATVQEPVAHWYTGPTEEQATAALRAKLAEVEGSLRLYEMQSNAIIDRLAHDRDEERMLADDLEQVVGAYILGADTLEVMRRHAARRKEQQG